MNRQPLAYAEVASRPFEPDVCLVEVRDADGELMQMASAAQAELLVKHGAASWRGQGRRAHLRLRTVLPPNSLRVLYGNTAQRKSNGAAIYSHNNRACKVWRSVAPNDPSELESARENRERLEQSRSKS